MGHAAAKWRQIGVALKFSKNVLDTIAATSGNSSPEDCFTDLLSRWLNWAPPNHDLPTVKTLAEALRECTVGEERMANNLMQGFERKMLCIFPDQYAYLCKFCSHTIQCSNASTPNGNSVTTKLWYVRSVFFCVFYLICNRLRQYFRG